ncbi:MAG: amino acid adenylation domain-containing protein [Cyanobacteriota bacterium]|nr:amino acid adenylation domain-containing protein [Cyanobacteriota bacterium]
MLDTSQTATLTQGFQLSLQQKQLWQLQQSLGIQPVNQILVSLKGQLNIDRLKRTLQTIGNGCEILRTSFQERTELQFPLQVVAATRSLSWNFIDLTAEVAPQQQSQIAKLQQLEGETIDPTELDKTWQVTLIQLAAEHHLLLLTLSALCSDRVSLHCLGTQIAEVYASGGEANFDGEELVQYLQVSQWQQEIFDEEEAETGKNYWLRSQFVDSPVLSLPAERESVRQTARASYSTSLDGELYSKISDRVQHNNSTLLDGLLASWFILLWRLTSDNPGSFALHYYSKNRPYPELQQTLGYLAKALPLSAVLTANLQFEEALEQVALARSEALEWQDYCETGIAPSDSIGFEFCSRPPATIAADVTFTIEEVWVASDRSKLKLTGIETETGLELVFDYNTASFDATAIERLAEEFQTLLASLVRQPDCTIAQLPLVGDRERHYLCVELNQTQRDFPQPAALHRLFEEQVEQNPHLPALQFGEQTLTYQQLNQKANQLARYFQQQGVRPETLVAIAPGNPVYGIIALLATLKAGGAYVPLESGLPAERLTAMLAEIQPAIFIAESARAADFPSEIGPSPTFLKFDTATLSFTQSEIALAATDNPDSPLTAANLAYVIFTSGSTGKPKGVAVEHEQLLNYLYGLVERLQLPANAHYATPASLAADLGNTAIFAALCRGGCLHVFAPEFIGDPLAWATYCQRHPIDCLKIVPSHLTALLTAGNPQQILPKQCLILGGEAAPQSLIRQVQANAPNCKIVNHYGPTETTIGVLTYTVDTANPDKETETGIVPLGRPLPNTEIYILDGNLQLVPSGVAGEIYIGGAGLARGYYQQPEMTAERFIPHPFAPDGRLYRTGDGGRYRTDGVLEFLGRLDRQVKIRGFRVELAEIEIALTQYSAVREACVVAITSELNGTAVSLAAYLVPTTNTTINLQELRDFLRPKLPDFMIPTSFTTIDALPRTPSGKIDRRALPEPESPSTRSEDEATPPSNAIEAEIAKIWTELLPQNSVSIHDNFFDLGGHSLLATQAIARLRQSFPVEIPLRYLFEAPTIAELAQLISQLLEENSSDLEELLAEIEAETF